MSLTWKDAVATLVTGGALTIAWVAWRQLSVPLLNNPRLAAVGLALLGVGLCAFGSNVTPTTNPAYMTVMGVLGGVALLLLVLAYDFWREGLGGGRSGGNGCTVAYYYSTSCLDLSNAYLFSVPTCLYNMSCMARWPRS